MLQDTNRDIQRLCQEDLRRRWRLRKLDRVVHAIDDLLFQLEDLNLRGSDRVPAVLRERAGQILDAVPGREEHENLRVRYRVVPMMDVLFRAQEVLFRLRDPRRALYEAEDEEEAANQAAMNEAPASSDGQIAAEIIPQEALVAAAE
ncbi:MAG TPA: hypothetical protein VKI99_17675 [Candidatus Dormibacteraeota bacterium]|nr:hypothetical protein [Candidatus Dormibacteraeota bacterium]